MKILKYLVLLIAVLALIFIAIGFLKPTVAYGHKITVDKPIEEAWAVMEDPSKYGEWLEGFKSIDLISGKHGEVGSKYKVIVNPGDGQEDFEMIETIAAIKRPEMIELDFASDMMDFNQITTMNEEGGKTTVETKSTVSAKGMMLRSMFAMMEMFASSFTAQEAKNIEALKKVIEENKTDYSTVKVLELEKSTGH